MKISQSLLNQFSSQAKASPRLRQAYDLRNSENDNSQRMLNALEPGTVMPIHRHIYSSETVAIIRGSLIERFYDENGNVTEEILMAPVSSATEEDQSNNHQSSTIHHQSSVPVVQVEKGRWHSLECLETGTVLFESKDGAWEPLAEEDVMKLGFKGTGIG